jgi:hypothetical protein
VPWGPAIQYIVMHVREACNLIKFLEDTWAGRQSGADPNFLSPEMTSILHYMAQQRQRDVKARTHWYWDLRGKLIVACLMYRKGQRWRSGAYLCSTLYDPDPSVSCDGWTAGGERLEIKCCGSSAMKFVALNVQGYERFIGIQADPIISESINWEDWVRCAFGHTLPGDFEDYAIAWEQCQQALSLRLAHCKRTLNVRDEEIISSFDCDATSDEPCPLCDVDFV